MEPSRLLMFSVKDSHLYELSKDVNSMYGYAGLFNRYDDMIPR